MKHFILSLALALMGTGALSASENHVFWYNCVTNGYGITANPGPALPSDVIKHEGMILSSMCRTREGNVDGGFNLGNYDCGMGGPGFCAAFWSKDLMSMTGTVSYAAVRGEYKDLYGGGCQSCVEGSVKLKVGVVDYSGNIDGVWGSADDVPATASWMDPNNLLGWAMTYNADTTKLMCEDTMTFMVPAGSQSAYDTPLDKHFMELPVTKQVNWILAHTGANKGAYSGQYAIVFLVNQKVNGGGGKLGLYADESGNIGAETNDPWTADGNTMHLFMTIGPSNNGDHIKLIETASPTFNRRPVFNWYSDTLVSTYRILIGATAGLASPIINLPLTDTFYQPTINLPYDTIYWKVGDFDNVAGWSSLSSFIIQDSLQPNITATPASLSALVGYLDSATQKLAICNTGRDTLTYAVECGNVSSRQILAWTYYADLVEEFPRTLAAIRQYVPGCVIDTTATIAAATLQARLTGKDIFLVTDPASYVSTTIGTAFAPVLRDFVTRGGVVIFCAPGSALYPFTNATGLTNITYSSAVSSGTTLTLAAPGHSLFKNLLPPLTTQNATYSFLQADSSTVLASYGSYAIITEKRIGRGSVVTLGVDFYFCDSNWAHIISNAVTLSPALPSWLTCAEDSGIVLPGACKEVSFQFKSGALTGSVYTGNITLRHNSPYAVNPMVVPCTLRLPPPEITAAPLSFSASLRTGDSTSGTLTLSNTGDALLNFNIQGRSGGRQILINEVNVDYEFLELWNRGPETDIGGWRLAWTDNAANAGAYTIPAGTKIKAGKCMMFIQSTGISSDSIHYMSASGWMLTTAVSMTLLDNTGRAMDFMKTGTNSTAVPAGLAWYGSLSTAYSWYRNRNTDSDSASDWTPASSSSYTVCRLNPGQSPTTVSGGWLSVHYDSSNVLPGGSQPVTVLLNAGNLIYGGLYVDSLLVTHNALNQPSPLVVRCSLMVKSTIPVIIPVSPDPTSLRRPVLTWRAVDSIGSYTIQITTSPDFSATFITQPLTDTFYVPSTNLPLGTIYWRVKSDLSAYYSKIDSFLIQSDSIPRIIPMMPETLIIRRPLFAWHPGTGASVYKIQIDTNGTFVNPLVTLPVSDTFYLCGFNLPLGRMMWRVSNVSYNETKYSAVDTFVITSGVGTEEVSVLVPDSFGLGQNFPNPFNPTTTIAFSVPPNKRVAESGIRDLLGQSRHVSIRIYDLNGRQVRSLLNGRVNVGFQKVLFDGRTDAGKTLTSGIYVCKMNADGFRKTIKIFMMK